MKAYLTGLLVVISKKKSSLNFTARIILLILLKEISFRFIKKFFEKENKLGLSWAKLSSSWGLKLEFEVKA